MENSVLLVRNCVWVCFIAIYVYIFDVMFICLSDQAAVKHESLTPEKLLEIQQLETFLEL